MAYLGAIDLVVNKTVSILTIKRLPTAQINTPDIGITTTQVTTYSIGFNSNITAKFDITMGGLTGIRTVPIVQTYYNKTFNYISNTNTTVNGISQVTSLKYNPITIGGPSVNWNTNSGSLGTFLTNSVVSLIVSASTNTGGTLSYAINSGSLPVNLSLNTANGAITGIINNTVTTNTTYTFTIRATESIAGAYTDNIFTITESARDPYFNYVTLLLNGESPSGNSKNTNTLILDNSNSALSLVPVNKGNVSQGSYGPFNTVNPNGWSTFFTRSSSDGLVISGNNIFNFLGVSDFTCEAWIFMNSMPVAGDTWPTNYSNNFVVMECGTASLGDGFSCIIGATKIFVQSNDVQYGSVTHNMTNSTWYHVAWVRYNGVLYFYVNGTQAGSIAFAVNVGTGANTFIGSETGQGAFFDGHISNVRVIQNQALYTGAFTPSTAPLTRTTVGTSGANVAASITGTVTLLMSQNNRFIENSVNNYTITIGTGAPKCVTLSPFAHSNYFASATSGVSGYFSGTTGDCLYQANNTTLDRLVNWFTPQFYSIECWINPTGYAVNGTVPVLIGNMDNTTATTNYWSFGLFSGGILRFYYYNGAGVTVSTTNIVPIGTWSHIAFVKVGLNIMLYINGVLSASAVISGTPQWNTAYPLTIGQYGSVAWGGYLYNLRINSSLFSTTNPYNSAIYPPVFALPSATLGVPSTLATSGVQLLTAQSATFVDNSPNTYSVNNGIAPFSNTYSYLFNGSNQTVNWSNPATLAFGTSAAFTIEFWLYVPNWSTAPVLVDWRPSATQGVYITIYSSTSGQIKFYTSSADRITTSITIPTHTWAHVAVVRNTAVTKIYINGVADGNTYADTNSYLVGTNRPIIGNGNAASAYFYGAMSNLRVNTTAVYTSNFTPPTTALTNITGTVLLTANSTTIADTITANNPLTNSANPVVESGSLLTDNGNIPVTGTYNIILPGTKLMSVNYNLNYNLTDEFTIEFWVYCIAHGSGGGLISFGNAWQITWSAATNALKFEGNNAAVTLTSATVLSLSTWYHVALVRAGSVMRFYINGISDSTTTTSLVAFTAVGTGSTPSIVIGADKTLSIFTSGYISNVRFINRRAYYLQGFPIPTTPFTNPTNVNGTQLLTAQSSTVTDNSGNPIVLQPTGFAITNSAIPFANTYSYTFNGTNSNVYTPGVVALDLNGDFTIECWFNINNTGATTSCMLLNRGGGANIAWASYELFIINGGIYFAASSANTSYDIGGEGTAQGLIGLFSPNTWNHVAVTRNSNTYRGFLNGQMSFYQVLALTPYSVGTARGLTIGSNYQTTYFVPANITSTFNGYVSNFRIVKGNALYTSNFTPSTTPLTAVTGTSLLTLQSATLVDNSSYVLPLTASGYSFSSNIIPFASGSISTGFQNNTNFTGNLPVAINTSNFSLDFWVYPQSFTNSTNPGIFDTRTSASDAAGFGVYLSSTNLILRIGAAANNMLTTGANNTPFTNTYSYTFTTNTYLTVPDNALFQFGTGDFTIEMWILHTNFTAAQGLFDKAYQSAGGISMIAAITTGLVSVYMSSATPVYTETGSLATNTWYHIALTRQGNSLRFFRNGTQIGSTITLTTQTVTAAVIESIGANLTSGAGTTPANYFNGNMSNLRVFKGASVYTSNFTPQTSNFSIGGGGITYMTSTYYGTFNGSTTYLNVNYNANQNLAANNWTMDAWVNPSSLANGPGIMNSWQIGGMFIWYINTSGYLGFTWTNVASGVSSPGFVGTSRQVALNVWSHVAVVRNGATITLYVNGQADATTYNIGGGTLYYYNGGSKDIRIGINADLGNPFTGLISNVRLVNGTALYTGAFTPAGPLANVTNTVVLTLQDSSVIDRSTTPATITNNGPVTMTFASASQASLLTLQSATIIDNSPNTFTISNPGSSLVTVSTVSGLITNGWAHVALIKNSGMIFAYLNGVLKSSVADTSTFSNTKFFVGSTFDPYYFQGYINNLRLVTGAPSIVTNLIPNSIPFLPTTTALSTTSQGVSAGNVTLLTAQSATIVDNSTSPLTLTNSASAVTTTNAYIPFASTYSYFFNGTTQYLTAPTGTAFQFPGDFTIECWVYSSTGAGQASGSGIFDTRTTNVGSATAILLYLPSSGYINFYVNSVNYASNTLLGSNIWAHIALVRSGTIITLFQNGIPVAIATGMTFNFSNGYCWIGALAGAPATSFWAGYISNLRIVKSAVYTMPSTSFSAPTSNTSITNSTVQLLTAQSATIVDNSINGFSLTNTGTVTAGNSIIPFSGTYSYQFNGTNYLTATSSTSFNMATYDFTIESWIYLTSYNYGIPAALLTAQSPYIYDNSPNRFSFTNNGLVGISSTTIPFANTYSYQFNGTTQYLTIPSTASFSFGNNDFTVEAWVYAAAPNGTYVATLDRTVFGGFSASSPAFFCFLVSNTNQPAIWNGTTQYTSSISAQTTTWTHVAWVRNNNTLTIYVNGQVGLTQGSYTTSFTTNSTWYIGRDDTANDRYFSGNISNLRVINGRALYTTAFTPSTTPLTALASGTGNPIVGTTNGAQTGYSLWISPDASTINFTSNATGYWTNVISATTAQLSLNTWYHIAVTRQGSTINIWRNGLSVASAATFVTNTFLSPNNAAYIGYFNDGSITRNFNGYISNLRVTQGLALYSSTFSQPLSPLTVSSNVSIPPYIANNFYNPATPGTNNTLLLFGQTASYADNSTYVMPLLPSNATPITVNSVIPYSNTYSFDFQGLYASTYLSIPPNANFDLAYYGFTIEFWIFPRFFDSLDGTIISAGNNLAGVTWRLTGNISGALSFIGTGTVTFTTANNTINFNTWSHIAIARFNYAHTIFVNGVSKAAGYSTAVPTTVGKYLYIGYGYSSANKYQSFLISNVRFVSGTTTNVYFNPFNTPSTNLTAIPNTTFLLGNSLGFGITASQGYAPSIATGGVTFALPSTSVIPFANTYSWAFNGNSAISWPGFVVGTAQFTMELWFYNTTNNWTNISLLGPNAANTNALGLWINTNGNIKVDQYGITAYNFAVPQMLQNTWYHVAAVRDGNNFCTVFLNGVRSTTGYVTNTTNYSGTTNAVGLLNTNGYWTGYISNVRIAFGVDTALYDVSALTITVPTTSLTAVTNTQLLTCQNLGMVDNSLNDYVMTNSSAYPTISDRVPFANTYSVYFSAAGNYGYVKAASSTLTTFGANDFTIECWCYFMNPNASTNYQVLCNNYNPVTGSVDGIWWGKHQSYSGYVAFWIYNYNQYASALLVETTYPPNRTWVHYAVVRTGSTFTMYRNGTATSTSAGVYSGYVSGVTSPIYIGISGDNDGTGATTNFQGYISNFRITKGIGVYTGTFTPPTTALGNTQGASTNIASISTGSVVLLTCQSDQFVDNSLSNLTITNGIGSITAGSTVVPFTGGYSIGFSASNHYLQSTVNSTQYALSGVPFTVEAWIYLTGYSPSYTGGYFQGSILSSIPAANTTGWLFCVAGTATSWTNINIVLASAGIDTRFNYNFNLGTWYHVAWTYDVIAHRFYVNGMFIGALNSSATWTDQTTLFVGFNGATNYGYYFPGYISNARIVKGSVVYGLGTFTPSTTALTTAVNSTVLLTAQSTTIIDNSILDWNILNTGAGNVATTNSITPFSSTNSYIFNGLNNMLSISTGGANSLELQDDFTIEFWFNSNTTYGSSISTSATLLNKNGGWNIAWPSWAITLWGNSIYFGASSNNDGYDIGGEPGGYLRTTVPVGNSGTINGVGLLGTFIINNWYHIAIVRRGGIYKGYLNGTNTWTQGGMNPYTTTSRGLNIGGTYGGDIGRYNYVATWGGSINSRFVNTYGFFNGYISNIRISNGTAVYTANFTPATSALTATTTTAYTALLTAQSSTAIDNSPITKYILGGPTYATNSVIPFANTYSYSLLGTADNGAASGYITLTTQGPFMYTTATTPFTMEMWLFPVVKPTGNNIMSELWTGSVAINFSLGFAAYGSTGDLGLASGTGDRIAFGYYNGSAWIMTPPTTALELFKWTHVAAVFDGAYASLYLNGVLNGQIATTWTTALSDTIFYIGKRWDNASQYNNTFQGYISNLRYVKGQALYSTNFTPPTSTTTATTTTSLLLNFDNANIYDASAKNDIVTYNNTSISGYTKYGTGSMYFNRTDPASYLIIPASTYLVFPGDFTIECWVNLASMPTSNIYPDAYWIFGTGAAATAAGTDLFVGSTLLNFNLTTTATPEISIAHSMVANTWYHIAICRAGTNLRAYVGGVLKQTATASTASSVSGYNVVIGRSDIAGSANTSGGFNGYIDDLRITKYARYTSTTTPTAFTPPTGPLPIG